MNKTLLAVAVCLTLAACSSEGGGEIDRTKTIVRGINYVGVSVSDLDRATAFYAGATDLKSVETGTLEHNSAIDSLAGRAGVRAETHLMKSVNAQLRFMQFAEQSPAAGAVSPTPVNGPGIAHVCFQVAKSTRAYDRFLEAGATHVGARDMVQLNPQRPVEYAYARDHDGIIFEVEHVDIAALDLPEPPKNKYRMRHVALATSDIDRAVEFYSVFLEEENPRRFGWWFWGLSGEVFDKVSGFTGTEIKMAWFQVRNMELEIGEYLSPPAKELETPKPVDAHGYNMIVFDVSDLDAARAKFIEAGGAIVSEVEQMDGGQILFGRDPDGNLLGMQVVSSTAPASSQNFKDNGI